MAAAVPPPPTHTPSAEQLDEAARRIDAAAAALDADAGDRRRKPNAPVYRFHPAGTAVYGTAVLFHGFSGEPYGMRWVAAYLHDAGWNVYTPLLAGHGYGGDAWPQVTLRPEFGGADDRLRQAAAADPSLAPLMDPTAAAALAAGNPADAGAALASLVAADPRLAGAGPPEAYMAALEAPSAGGPTPGGSPDFAARFVTDADAYKMEGLAAVEAVGPLPGPVVLVGSSVGGTVALAVAAALPRRVSHVVACAPLLRLHDEDKRRAALAFGPLGVAPLQGWSPTNKFPLACFTANDVFGATIAGNPATRWAFSSRNVRLFLMLTENEDAADIETNRAFFAAVSPALKGGGNADGAHVLGVYPREARVPHPMVDPTETSQGMTNAYWGSLMGETFRFITTGEVDVEALTKKQPAAELPPPPSELHRGWP